MREGTGGFSHSRTEIKLLGARQDVMHSIALVLHLLQQLRNKLTTAVDHHGSHGRAHRQGNCQVAA